MHEKERSDTILSVTEVAVLALVFAVVHALAYIAGLRYDAASLGLFMQFLDPELLRQRLIESLFYLHIQPPLFNLFLGVGLKLGDAGGPVFFQGVYLVLGFLTYAAIYALQRRLYVSQRIAFATSTVFMASPAFLLTEHWLFYTFPCAAVLTLSCVCLCAFARKGNRGPLWAFFGCLLLLAGLRSVFHLVWVAAIGGSVMAVFPRYRKRVALAAGVAFFLAALPYAKNAVLFGEFTQNSWSGKHLWIKTVGNMDPRERRRLYNEGLLTDVSRPGLNRFETTGFYPQKYVDVTGFEDIPALRQFHKSTGHINYNHLAQIAISRDYGRDARYVLLRYPKTFLLTTLQAGLVYFQSNASWARESANYARLRPWVRLYDGLVYGKLPVNAFASLPNIAKLVRAQYAVLMLVLPLAFLAGAYAAIRGRFAGFSLGKSDRILFGYMAFNILFVGGLAVLFEIAETARIRFMTDPLSVVLLGFVLQRAIAHFKTKWHEG
ncbi:MAG: hypothetical protein R6V12_10870 [Candidatus Hydrogenedentota bacterium]